MPVGHVIPPARVTAMTRALTSILILGLLSGCMGGGAAKQSMSQQKLADLQVRAQINADKGFYDDARLLLHEALRLASALDDQQGQAAILVQQARLARQNGDLAHAGQAVAQALQLSSGSLRYADAAQEMALQELAANRTDMAVHWAKTALNEERGGLLARRLNLLARLALIQGRRNDAGILAEQALAASSETLAAERANALRMLGTVRGQQQRYEEGEQLLGQALQLDKELELPTRIAADLEALAELAALRRDVTAQQHLLQRAKTVRENMLPKKTRTPY